MYDPFLFTTAVVVVVGSTYYNVDNPKDKL